MIAECTDKTNVVATADVDVDAMRLDRASWGLFRDRRPNCYQDILALS
jgi:N-carbamoylputrescine amidase